MVDTVSPYVYTVEDLISTARTDVHASFIKRYADADLTVTPQLLVRWEGFVDPTWEPLHTVFSDTPVSVRRYARTVMDLAQRAALLALLRDLAA